MGQSLQKSLGQTDAAAPESTPILIRLISSRAQLCLNPLSPVRSTTHRVERPPTSFSDSSVSATGVLLCVCCCDNPCVMWLRQLPHLKDSGWFCRLWTCPCRCQTKVDLSWRTSSPSSHGQGSHVVRTFVEDVNLCHILFICFADAVPCRVGCL